MSNEEKILSLLESLVQGQAKLEKDLSETKNIVARIEVEHGQHIKALHDGYAGVYDISKEIRSDVAEIKDVLEVHAVHINVLEHAGK